MIREGQTREPDLQGAQSKRGPIPEAILERFHEAAAAIPFAPPAAKVLDCTTPYEGLHRTRRPKPSLADTRNKTAPTKAPLITVENKKLLIPRA